jgi:hypothetical protein
MTGLIVATSFEKVFKLPDGTVVFVSKEDTAEENEDRGVVPYSVRTRFSLDDVIIQVTPTYPDEEKRDAFFDRFDIRLAEIAVEGVKGRFFKEKNTKLVLDEIEDEK